MSLVTLNSPLVPAFLFAAAVAEIAEEGRRAELQVAVKVLTALCYCSHHGSGGILLRLDLTTSVIIILVVITATRRSWVDAADKGVFILERLVVAERVA